MGNFPFVLILCLYLIGLLFFYQEREQKNKKMAFNFLVTFWQAVDENGSMDWSVSEDKISILYYFNNENINFQKILQILNSCLQTYGLD